MSLTTQSLIETLPGAVAVLDTDMRFLAWNRTWTETFGPQPDADLTGLCHYEVYPEVPERWRAMHRRALLGETLYEPNDPLKHEDGTVEVLEWRLSPWRTETGDIGGVVLTTKRVSPAAAADQAEALHRDRLERALAATDDGLWDWELEGDALYLNAKWFHMLGLVPGSLAPVMDSWRDRIHPHDRAMVAKALEDCRTDREDRIAIQYRIRGGDGNYLKVLCRGRVVERDGYGNAIRLSGSQANVTALSSAQNLSHPGDDLSGERFRTVFEKAAMGIALVNTRTGALEQVNGAFCDFMKRDAETLKGLTFGDLTHPADLSRSQANNKAIRTGEADSIYMDKRYLNPDGSTIWGSVALTRLPPAYPEEDPQCILMVQDITEDRRRMEALAESEARFRTIFDKAALGIALVDGMGYPYRCNPELQRLLGYTEAELKRISLRQCFHPDDLRIDFGLFRDLREGKRGSYQIDKRFIRKDGSVLWAKLSVSALPITDSGGSPTYLALIQDISEQREAEQALRYWAALLQTQQEASPAGILVASLGGSRTLENWNSRFLELWGLTPDIMAFDDSLAPLKVCAELTDDPDGFIDQITDLYNNPAKQERGTHIMLKDGRTLERYSQGVKDAQGDYWGRVWFFFDITEQVKARREAEAATEAKSAFLANMSHEIRTPLNAVIGMARLLLRSGLTGKQKGYATKVVSSSEALLGVINDILDFSKIEAGKLDLERVAYSLEEILQHAVDLLGIGAEEKGLDLVFRIEPETPLSLIGDPLRLGQILSNLLSNAIKFTDEGEVEVSVSAKAAELDDVELTIEVRDTGIGLSEEQKERLFQAFTQGDSSTTRRFGGTGLGLEIARNLSQMMGGGISVASREGGGSTFRATVRQSVSGDETVASLFSSPENRKALVVLENASTRTAIDQWLTAWGYGVYTPATEHEAASALTDLHQWSLVVIDRLLTGCATMAPTLSRLTQADEDRPACLIVGSAHETAQGLPGPYIQIPQPVLPGKLRSAIVQACDARNLPPESLAAPDKHHGPAAPTTLQGLNVLVAEDNPINQELAKELLEDAGMRVSLASDGQQACDAALAGGFDAVLMDIQMPVMDGYEATRRIRETFAAEDLPVIAMTAHAMESERLRCLTAGMNAHLTKPMDVERLYSVLHKWTKSKPKVAENVTETSAEHSAFPPSLPGVNIDQGLALVGGRQDLYQRIVDYFLDTFGEDNPVRQALSQNDSDTAHRWAHTIKGLAGNLGADTLRDQAAALDTAFRTGEPPEETALQAFDTSFDQVMSSLHSLKREDAAG